MSDLSAALSHWYNLLKPSGKIAIHAFSENSFIAGTVSQKIMAQYGIELKFNKPTGTVNKCHKLFELAGFKHIEVKVETNGYYMDLAIAQKVGVFDYPTPGQYPNPISQLSAEQLTQAKIDFETELLAINTDQGIWNNTTIFYLLGTK